MPKRYTRKKQKGGASKDDYELLYKMLLVVTPYADDERGYGVSLLEQLPDSKVVKNMGGEVTSREPNADAREKMLKTFKNFIKTFKLKSGPLLEVVPQLIEKLKQVGMETEAGVINQIQEICRVIPCPAGERRVKKKQLKRMASTYLQELGFDESDVTDNSKLLKTLQSIIKVPMGQGFWRLVSKSVDKQKPKAPKPSLEPDEDPGRRTPETDFDTDAEEMQDLNFSSVLPPVNTTTPQDDDWTFEDIEETGEADEAKQNAFEELPPEEEIEPQAPKKTFWQKVKSSIGIRSREEQEEDELLSPDDLPPVEVDFDTPNQLTLTSTGDRTGSVVVDADGNIHHSVVSDPKMRKATKRRQSATRGEEDTNVPIQDDEEDPLELSTKKQSLKKGTAIPSTTEDGSLGEEEQIEPSVDGDDSKSKKKRMTIEVIADEDAIIRTHGERGDKAEYYFEVLSDEISNI